VTVRVLQGHVVDVLATLPARSVHVCVTSPPYWQLRAYGTPPQAWGDGWCGELGQEPRLDAFIGHLVEVFAAVGRVLRDDGTLWVNIADSYFSNPGGQNGGSGNTLEHHAGRISAKAMEANRQVGRIDRTGTDQGLKPGDLCLAPARFALAMQAAGWRLRSEITLCKTAPMPESVSGARWERCKGEKLKPNAAPPNPGGLLKRADATVQYNVGKVEKAEWQDCPGCPRCEATDGLVQRWGSGRPTSATEKLYVFAKGTGAYYYDVEAVRVPMAASSIQRITQPTFEQQQGGSKDYGAGQNRNRSARKAVNNLREKYVRQEKWKTRYEGWEAMDKSAGRNAWNWMYFHPEPLQAAHYAAYPRWLPRLAIQAGTSERGCCPACGAPHLRIVDRRFTPQADVRDPAKLAKGSNKGLAAENGLGETPRGTTDTTTLGWRQSCRCAPHEPAPCTVLDPFSGSGTTVLEANALGRHGIGIELQATYVDIAHQRLAGAPLSLFAWQGQGHPGALPSEPGQAAPETGTAGAGEEAAG
jgi:DNA modification methylase